MNLESAYQLLGLLPGASDAIRFAAYEATRNALESKLANAPTPRLKEKYRAALRQMEDAIETIENRVDEGELPPLAPTSAPVERTEAHRPPPPLPSHRQPPASAARAGSKQAGIILIAVALAAVIGGVFWYLQWSNNGGILTVGEPWTIPDIDLEMQWIEPGTFQMGVPWYADGERPPQLSERDYRLRMVGWLQSTEPVTSGRWAEYRALISRQAPDHRVAIGKGFWIGTREVTQGTWRKIMGGNPSKFDKGDDYPVEQVSWDDAMSFCAKLNEIEWSFGRLLPNYRYTLPTEAEWEYAAVAGGSHTLSMSDTQAQSWNLQNGGMTTHPCGEKRANDWGLFDMTGNVSEWCRDWIGPYEGGTSVDPTGPRSGERKVFRGASYLGRTEMSRFLFKREAIGPLVKKPTVGFRIALTYKEARDPKAIPDPR